MTEQAKNPPKALDRPVSWSSLKLYDGTPAHWLHAQISPPEQTQAMLTGSALHCLTLEPMEYERRYVVAPEIDRRTRAGKEAWTIFQEEQAKGKQVLTREQDALVRDMHMAIRRHGAWKLIEQCDCEVRLDWIDDETGLPCTARLDAVSGPDVTPGVALDIKTCQDASPRGFARAAANSLYHGQAAFYLDALAAAGRPVSAFALVAVEKEPPHCVALHVLDDAAIEAGRKLYRRLLDLHAECLMHGEWPGYEHTNILSLPGWAL